MRYSRAPYEKAREDLEKALKGEGIQPPAPSAIPISEYYHVADAEIEDLLARQREQQERYRLIFEHQVQSHRYMKHQSDGERVAEDDLLKGRQALRGEPATGLKKVGGVVPPLFDPRKLDPQEEQKVMMTRALDSFLPSLLVPTHEGVASPSVANSYGKGHGTVALAPIHKSSNATNAGSAAASPDKEGSSPPSPTTQARLRHRSAKEQQLALLAQTVDPATGERVRLVENPYRRQREALDEEQRRRHLQPHTTELLKPLSYDEARETREPYKVLLETQAMLAAGRAGRGKEEGSDDNAGRGQWRRESLLTNNRGPVPQLAIGTHDDLAHHLYLRRLSQTAPSGSMSRLFASGDDKSARPGGSGVRLSPIRKGGAQSALGYSTTSAPGGGLTPEALRGKAQTPQPFPHGGGSFSMRSDGALVYLNTQHKGGQPVAMNSARATASAQREAEAEALRADRQRREDLKKWRSEKEDQLERQAQAAAEERVTQRQHYSSLNQRYRAIEAKLEEVKSKAVAVDEARVQEAVRQAESRFKSNALEALRWLCDEEVASRRRLEAEEAKVVNKDIVLSFEEGLARLRPAADLLPAPAEGALAGLDDTALDAFSLYGNDSRYSHAESDQDGEDREEDEQKRRHLEDTVGGFGIASSELESSISLGTDTEEDEDEDDEGPEGDPTTYFKRAAQRRAAAERKAKLRQRSDNDVTQPRGGGGGLRLPGIGPNGRLALTTFLPEESATNGRDTSSNNHVYHYHHKRVVSLDGGDEGQQDSEGENFTPSSLRDNNKAQHRVGSGFNFQNTNTRGGQSAELLSPRSGGGGGAGLGLLRHTLSVKSVKSIGADSIATNKPSGGGGGNTARRQHSSATVSDELSSSQPHPNAANSTAAAPAPVVYASLKPIDEGAPDAVKSWVTAFFNAPTPATTMRAIACSLGLVEPTAEEVSMSNGEPFGFSSGQPFQRVASLYAPSSLNDGPDGRRTPKGGGAGARGRKAARSKPLGFVGLM